VGCGGGCGGGNRWKLAAWQLASPAATNIKIENFVIFLLVFFFGKPAQRSHNSWRATHSLPLFPSLPISQTPAAAVSIAVYSHIYAPYLAITCMSVQFLQLAVGNSIVRLSLSLPLSSSLFLSLSLAQLNPRLSSFSSSTSCGKFSTGKNGSKAAAVLTSKATLGQSISHAPSCRICSQQIHF